MKDHLQQDVFLTEETDTHVTAAIYEENGEQVFSITYDKESDTLTPEWMQQNETVFTVEALKKLTRKIDKHVRTHRKQVRKVEFEGE